MKKNLSKIGVLFIALLALLLGCNKKEQKLDKPIIRYYMYDYYEMNCLLRRNAVIIKEIVLNDSISRLQITNHSYKIKNQYDIYATYDRMLYQKTTQQGIYFSEYGADYALHYDFNSKGDTINTTFPTYYFFGMTQEEIRLNTTNSRYLETDDEMRSVEIDSLTGRIKKVEIIVHYEPEDYYVDYRNFYACQSRTAATQIVFLKDFPFPLFTNEIHRLYNYLLSDVIGQPDGDRYVDEANKARWNKYLCLLGFPENTTDIPSRWRYKLMWRNDQRLAEDLHKRGFSISQIADSIKCSDGFVELLLEEAREGAREDE